MIKFNHLLLYLTKFTRFTGELSHILTVLQPPYEENECLQQDIKHPPVSEAHNYYNYYHLNTAQNYVNYSLLRLTYKSNILIIAWGFRVVRKSGKLFMLKTIYL